MTPEPHTADHHGNAHPLIETNSTTALGMTTPPPDTVVLIESTPFANTVPPTHNSLPVPGARGTRMPNGRFTIRIPSTPLSYAAALSRTANQIAEDEREYVAIDHDGNDRVAAALHDPKPSSGPIAGFSMNRVLENLDPLVRGAWEALTKVSVFVHYFDGGYNPNLAQNVHVIADELEREPPNYSSPEIALTNVYRHLPGPTPRSGKH